MGAYVRTVFVHVNEARGVPQPWAAGASLQQFVRPLALLAPTGHAIVSCVPE